MSELYELPDGWEWKNIDSIIENKNDFTDGNWVLAKDYDLPKEVRLLQLADVGEGYFIDKSNKWISEHKSVELKAKYINTGDILISRLGEILAKSCIIPKLNYKIMTSVDIAILRMNEDFFHNKYIMLYFNSNTAKGFINKKATGATRKRISRKNLGQIPIPLSPLQEQKRIVTKLDSLFEKIEKSIDLHQKNMDEADVFMGSILNAVFGELEEKGLITQKQLNECFIVKDGTHDSPKYTDSGFPLFTSKNLKDYGLNTSNYKSIKQEDYEKINKRSKVDKGDLLFAMIGTIGNPTIVDFEPNFAIKNVALFKPLDNESLITYLKYYFMSEKVITKMKNEANGATQKFVGLTYLRQFPFPKSTIEIQQKTVNYLDKISLHVKRVKEVQKEKMQNLKALKASILDQAFRGKL